MRFRPAPAALTLAAAVLLAFPAGASAQLAIGQYEEEAPVRTWNSFALATAAALGRGGTSMTFGRDASAALANPALLPGLPRFTAAVNGYLQSAALNMFGPVNTGVFIMTQNARLVSAGLDSGGVSVGFGGWALAFNVYSDELYGRPSTSAEGQSNGILYYEADFRQSGMLRTWQFAAARRIGGRISVGAAVNLVRGSLEREFVETSYFPTIIITDRKSQTFSGLYVSGGILARLSAKLQAAAIFRTPYRKEVKSESGLRYEAPSAGTLITIDDSADDAAEIPASAGLGLRLALSPDLDIMTEATATLWSKYSLTFFGDPATRDFRDIVKAGLGLEYRTKARLFGLEAIVPLRIGAVYDPQPAKAPRSAYAMFTFGTGVQGKRVGLDIGGMAGLESGSGKSLGIVKLALSLHYAL